MSGSLREGSSFNSSKVPSTPSSSDLLETSSSRGSSGGGVSGGARAPRTPGVEQARQRRQRGSGGSTIGGEPRGGRNVGLEEKEEEQSSPRDAVERGRSRSVLGESGGRNGQGGGVWGDGRGVSHGQEEGGEEDSGVYLEDMRGFVRREGQRLRESVRARRTSGGSD